MSTGRTRRRRGVALAAISSLLLLCASVVQAQTTGNLEGTVTDQGGGPLPGVTIALTSPNLQGARSATTGADGRYRFPGIPPGSYLVKASLEGFGTVEKKATVTLDATVAVDVAAQPVDDGRGEVSGQAPLLDKTSTTAGSSYSANVIERLPALEPQLRRHRLHAAGRPGRHRRNAGRPLARDLDLRLDLGGELVSH